MTRWLLRLAYLALLLAGCGSSPSAAPSAGALPSDAFWCSEEHASWCPVGATCLPSGGCWNAAVDLGETDAGCNPVACQALFDDALYGGGGACPGWCASACQAACSGDRTVERESLAMAAGESCPPCRY